MTSLEVISLVFGRLMSWWCRETTRPDQSPGRIGLRIDQAWGKHDWHRNPHTGMA